MVPKIKLKDAQAFKLKLIKSGYTQRAFAVGVGISITTLNTLVNEKRGVGAAIAKRITEALECEFDDIFSLDNDRQSNQTA